MLSHVKNITSAPHFHSRTKIHRFCTPAYTKPRRTLRIAAADGSALGTVAWQVVVIVGTGAASLLTAVNTVLLVNFGDGLKELKDDLKELKKELKGDIKELKADMKEGFNSIVLELKSLTLHMWDMDKRLTVVETKLPYLGLQPQPGQPAQSAFSASSAAAAGSAPHQPPAASADPPEDPQGKDDSEEDASSADKS